MKDKKLEKMKHLEEDYANLLARQMQLEYENFELKKLYQVQENQRDEIRLLHENTRRLKHDMKNHILVLASYLSENKVEEAKSYLSEILDKLNKVYTYIETGNSILNYCMNTKLQLAHQKQIEVKAEIENLAFQRLKSIDFTALLLNLLDNAIEACEKESVKYMEVSIQKKRGYEMIVVKNQIAQSVLTDNPELQSTKQDMSSHGYGMVQIKDIVSRYDGMIDIYEEKSMFCVAVAFMS